ncbi:AAA family ATPase [Streptomyces sp. So13.3]|uniref:AAA family ATPase n=1 Tax=unclassified Streptomyces TaxID=2593676 RepID=UPI0011058A43|nr:AAA family ATPase [Streptomyces sp. So13.3]NEA75411.1 AAA family ATPase [Streptomyces sp. SID13588]QNA73158.1 AAA family ATPase [Streptomyces sp. So13.3]
MVAASPIRIAVSGTHSTGKTTLLKRLEMEVRAQGFTVARTHGSLAKKAAELGFPKMRDQTATTTQWLIAAGMCAELEATLTADVVLVDRSAFDPLAYFLAGLQQRQEHLDDANRDLLTSLVATHSAGYTLLLATALDPTVPLGNHRDRDLNFRTSVDQHLHQLLATTGTPHLVVANTDACHDQARTAVLAAARNLTAAA